MSGAPVTIAISGKSTVPIGIGVHDRVERHAPEEPRGRIAEPIRRPRVRHLVDGQRKQQDDESDRNLGEVEADQRTIVYCGPPSGTWRYLCRIRDIRLLTPGGLPTTLPHQTVSKGGSDGPDVSPWPGSRRLFRIAVADSRVSAAEQSGRCRGRPTDDSLLRSAVRNVALSLQNPGHSFIDTWWSSYYPPPPNRLERGERWA